MTSFNIYWNYLDTSTNEGISLYDSAVTNITSPLVSNNKITLHPKDLQVFGDTGKSLSNQYRSDFLIQNFSTTRTVIDGADEGDPHTITYGDYINLLDEYAPNNLECARIYSSVI